MSSRLMSSVGVVLVALGLVVLGAVPVAAAPGDGYGTWTFVGSSRAFTGTADVAAGFPSMTMDSTSRAPAGIVSGASSWIPADTAFGTAFGSSQGKAYLALRPSSDTTTGPSVTTYTFAGPTPVGGWGMALGDVDAEVLTVTATGVGGAAVSGASLGLQTPFNYCDATPRSSTCSGEVASYVVPNAVTSGMSVTLDDPQCPGTPARCDTKGASAWFSPLVPLTVTSTWRSGAPQYQTWFASTARHAAGTVTADCAPTAAGVPVRLLRGDSTEVAATTTDTAGAYLFASFIGQPDYRVEIDPGAGADPVGPTTLAADLSATDKDDLDFALASRWPISGQVVSSGAGIPGAVVTLTRAGATIATVTTAADGSYSFARLAQGDYAVSVTSPPGYTAPAPEDVTVGCAAAVAPDLVLTAVPPTTPPTSTTTPPPTTPPPTTPPPTTTTTTTVSPTTSAPSMTPPGTTPPSPGDPGDNGSANGSLPDTGSQSGTYLIWAASFIASGLGILLLTRSRRTGPAERRH